MPSSATSGRASDPSTARAPLHRAGFRPAPRRSARLGHSASGGGPGGRPDPSKASSDRPTCNDRRGCRARERIRAHARAHRGRWPARARTSAEGSPRGRSAASRGCGGAGRRGPPPARRPPTPARAGSIRWIVPCRCPAMLRIRRSARPSACSIFLLFLAAPRGQGPRNSRMTRRNSSRRSWCSQCPAPSMPTILA